MSVINQAKKQKKIEHFPYTTWNPSWSCSIQTSENISSMKSSSVSERCLRGCFFFQACKERFCNRVVQRRSRIGERLFDPQLSEPFSEIEVRILNTLIAVKRQSSWPFPPFESFFERVPELRGAEKTAIPRSLTQRTGRQ